MKYCTGIFIAALMSALCLRPAPVPAQVDSTSPPPRLTPFSEDVGTLLADIAIPVGNLVDFSGPTAVMGRAYGQGKIDAFRYINMHGGILGRPLRVLTVDYAYILPKAVTAYESWVMDDPVVAIQGWGKSDAEALRQMVTRDAVPYFSAHYSAAFTDPTGKSDRVESPAPYHFFVGPSYSDGVRGLIQWAVRDWEKRDVSGAPAYVHMGADAPYPEAIRGPGEAYARQRGFTVLPAIEYAQEPQDFTSQCQKLKESGADYAYLGNTGGANAALLRACRDMGVETQFMASIWGYDETVMAMAGDAANGVVWVMGAAKWGADVPGMDLVRDISAMSGTPETGRSIHYLRGICSVFYMKEAMEMAALMPDGMTGPNIKAAMYERRNWVPEGLAGVCPPATWTPTDHRGLNRILVYEARIKGEEKTMHHVYTARVPRKPEWLGW